MYYRNKLEIILTLLYLQHVKMISRNYKEGSLKSYRSLCISLKHSRTYVDEVVT